MKILSYRLGFGLCAVLAGSAAMADPLLPLGCYARSYGAAHLAGQPAQIVAQMTIAIIHDADHDATRAPMIVTLADQGRARADGVGGQTFTQTLDCMPSESATTGPIVCGVECDGGTFDVLRADGQILEMRTSYLMVGDAGECGGSYDLAEILGKPVTYRLDRTEDAVCAALLP